VAILSFARLHPLNHNIRKPDVDLIFILEQNVQTALLKRRSASSAAPHLYTRNTFLLPPPRVRPARRVFGFPHSVFDAQHEEKHLPPWRGRTEWNMNPLFIAFLINSSAFALSLKRKALDDILDHGASST